MGSSFLRLAAAGTALIMAGAAALRAETAEQLLERGTPLDRKFQAREALEFYLAAEAVEPRNPAVLVRIARQYRHLMVDATDKVEKVRLGRIALKYSEAAAAIAPEDAEAQLSVAISQGKLLPLLGAKEQVAVSPRIRAAVDRTLQLDPRNDLAWHILGRWHRVLADVSGLKRALAGAVFGGLPRGSTEEAEKCFKRAIELNPNRLMHYVELGRVYAQMGRTEEARQLIGKGLAMPNVEKDDFETKQRGLETLAKLP